MKGQLVSSICCEKKSVILKGVYDETHCKV